MLQQPLHNKHKCIPFPRCVWLVKAVFMYFFQFRLYCGIAQVLVQSQLLASLSALMNTWSPPCALTWADKTSLCPAHWLNCWLPCDRGQIKAGHVWIKLDSDYWMPSVPELSVTDTGRGNKLQQWAKWQEKPYQPNWFSIFPLLQHYPQWLVIA